MLLPNLHGSGDVAVIPQAAFSYLEVSQLPHAKILPKASFIKKFFVPRTQHRTQAQETVTCPCRVCRPLPLAEGWHDRKRPAACFSSCVTVPSPSASQGCDVPPHGAERHSVVLGDKSGLTSPRPGSQPGLLSTTRRRHGANALASPAFVQSCGSSTGKRPQHLPPIRLPKKDKHRKSRVLKK